MMRTFTRFLLFASIVYVCPGLVLERKPGLYPNPGQVHNKADVALEDSSGPKTQVLFIVAGLMREYKTKWPIWQETVVRPNQADGVNFTIVVATDLNIECDSDIYSGKELACMCHFPRETHCDEYLVPKSDEKKRAFEERIRNAFLPEKIEVVDRHLPNGYMAQGKRSGQAIDEVTDVSQQALSRSLLSNESRHHHHHHHHHHDDDDHHHRHLRLLALNQYEHMHFDIVMSIRPDITLVEGNSKEKKYLAKYPGNEDYDRPHYNRHPMFDIKEVCRTHPGLNIISGDFLRPWLFHDRDWDWGSLLCDGSKLDLARETLYGRDGACLDEECPNGQAPPRPADFQSTKPWDCSVYTCHWIAKLNNKIRFGTLDDVVFAHLRN